MSMIIARIELVGESFQSPRKRINYRIKSRRAMPAQMWEISLSGDTYFAKHLLRKNGFQWNDRKWSQMCLSHGEAEAKLDALRADMSGYTFYPEYEEPEMEMTEELKDKQKRFYDGLVSQRTIAIGSDNLPIIRSLQEFVRVQKKYGQPSQYVLNKEFEEPGQCGVIFVDDTNKKLIAYSPPQEYFNLDVRA